MGWELYDELIEGVPEDVLVKDYCLGLKWSYVEAESGMGASYTCRGGSRVQEGANDYRGAPLREMAGLAKSWNFEEASLGIAALNAWYSQSDRIDPMGAIYDEPIELPDGSIHKIDAFEVMRPRIEAAGNAHVVVVGHFPHVDRIAEFAQLTVLERSCHDKLDIPDPACEYLMPEADFAFITGVTIENKTVCRLLELAKDATTIMVGPSVVMSPTLFGHGVDIMAGSVVMDEERVRHAVKSAGAMSFGGALQMVTIER